MSRKSKTPVQHPQPATENEKTQWEPQVDTYWQHVHQAWQDIQSSTDSFDRNLLALSSGALTLSLAFIKEVVPLHQAVWVPLLLSSWACFIGCMLVTVASFRFSIAALHRHVGFLEKVYLNGEKEYFNKKSWYQKAVTVCTWTASSTFVAGMACTVIFVGKNLLR